MYPWSAALGEIINHEAYIVTGYRSNIAATLPSYEVVGPLSASRPPMPFTAAQVEVVSTSANDTSGGTGIQQVMIDGLDATGARQTETVTLNGVTAVTTTGSWTFINMVHAESVGSGGQAAGDISIQSVGGGTEYTRIPAGFCEDQQLFFRVPTGSQVVIGGWGVSVTTSKASIMRLRTDVDAHGNVTANGSFAVDEVIANQAAVNREFPIPKLIPAGGMFWVDGADLSVTNGQVVASIGLIWETVS